MSPDYHRFTASYEITPISPWGNIDNSVQILFGDVRCKTCKLELTSVNLKVFDQQGRRCISCFRKHVAMKALKGRR